MPDETKRIERRGGDRKPTDKSNEAEWLSKNGGVRCGRIKTNGKRCGNWAALGYTYCKFHGACTGSSRAMYTFESQEAQDTFLKFRNKEDYLSVKDELAVIRFCMEQLLKNFERAAKKKNDGVLTSDSLLVLSEMSKNVTQVAKDCNTIERGLSLHISIETLEMWLGQIVDVLADCGVDDDTLTAFVEKVGKTQMPTGGRKSLRDMVAEDDAEDEEGDGPERGSGEDLYDDSDEEVSAETKESTAGVSKPTESPATVKDRKTKPKKKKKKKRDGPRNKRDEPRGDKPRKGKRRGLTVRRK